MSKRATIRKITIDDETYNWCVTKDYEMMTLKTMLGTYQLYQLKVAVWPVTYKGKRLIEPMGPAAEVGQPNSVTPRDVASFIEANKKKF